MKAFIIACAVAIVIAVVSIYVLDGYQIQADSAFASPQSVRL